MTKENTCQTRCSLSPAALTARTATVSELLRTHPHRRTSINGGRRLTFTADPQLEHALHELVALEADCCPFLTMTITADTQEISLTVTGSEDAQDQFSEIFGS